MRRRDLSCAIARRSAVACAMVVAACGTVGDRPVAPVSSASAAGTADTTVHLGKPLSPSDVARIDISVFPDGRGLPAGSGTARRGETIYRAQCASCHGANGIGSSAQELAGGTGALSSADPDKTIGFYWPYATTLFDFTRRSMPMGAPWSLSADDTYAVTAYLLFLNGLIDRDSVLDARSLPAVRMPNRDGFDPVDAVVR